MNRRDVLKSALCLMGSAAWPTEDAVSQDRLEQAQHLQSNLALDPRRPQFHLLPKKNWMNDPNGPIYWNGQYHMFFQYNPNAAVWGDMHWAHAVSEDMVHWKHLPIALAPTPGGPDAAGCFSGTAVVDHGVVTVMYTGVVDSPAQNATVNDGVNTFIESQCLAIATDKHLTSWNKMPQPVIPKPPLGNKVTGFRDPSPWKIGAVWYVAIGSGTPGGGGEVLLYRSMDLRHWEYLHPIASGQRTGKSTVNPVGDGDMWECPDLFPLDGKHVLIYSSMGKVHWQSGSLDEIAMRFHPEKAGVLDYGAYYAAKTQEDAYGRRILWGWIPERRPKAEYSAAGWAGMMSLPRTMRLRADGELSIGVDKAVDQLRIAEQSLEVENSLDGQLQKMRVRNATGEICGLFARRDAQFSVSLVGVLPKNVITEPIVKITYKPTRPGEVTVNETKIPIHGPTLQPLKIHMYVDGSVVEIVLQNTAAYTRRFYYAGSVAPDIYVKVDGPKDTVKSLQMWQFRPISHDRLTT